MTKHVDFKTFLSLWNRAQGQATPGLHFRMAEWLEEAWRTDSKRLLLQAFRSGGKSTIAGLFAAWLLSQQPDLRILVLAADQALAGKMVRQVRRIIERHPLTLSLCPDDPDQWASDRFTVRRTLELRDPSMLARGVSANVTGSRADIVICDDVEVPNTCDTPEKRRILREQLAEIDFVMAPGATLLYIGTPHTWHTIYADVSRKETGEERAFLEGFVRLTIPVADERGLSAWPERYTDGDIARMRRESGPQKFASQMMLTPVNIAEGRLDSALLAFYNDELQKSDELRGLYLRGKRLVSCSAWWDPALGLGGDASALAVVFTDADGGVWLQNVTYINVPPLADGDDEASFQCRIVAQVARGLFIPALTVEINGLGRLLPNILRRELARERIPCAVREFSSRRPKDVRILEAFDSLLAARRLNVHDSVRKTPFITEMQEWRPGGRGHDDGLDAVAGALSLAPSRLEFSRFSGRHSWHGGAAHTAKTDFEV